MVKGSHTSQTQGSRDRILIVAWMYISNYLCCVALCSHHAMGRNPGKGYHTSRILGSRDRILIVAWMYIRNYLCCVAMCSHHAMDRNPGKESYQIN
jgi:hypothetical protein